MKMKGLEAVARAIRDTQHLPPSCDYPQCMCDYECERDALTVATYIPAARAAITAYEAAKTAEGPVVDNDEIRDFWRQWAARRLEISRTHWLRASERALNGDLRELRLRVEQAKAPQARIVASAPPPPQVTRHE